MPSCQFCGGPLNPRKPVPRQEECPSCKRDVHCCRQCRHYDPALNNSCRETQADWVADKDRRNFCDYFEVSTRPGRPTGAKESLEDRWKKLRGGK